LFSYLIRRLHLTAFWVAALICLPCELLADNSLLSKIYIGGGGGVGIQYFEPEYELFPITDAAHGVLGGRVYAGYQLTRHWGVELGYTNIGTYHNDGSNNHFICTSSDLQECIANFPPVNRYFNENLDVKNSINSSAIDLSTRFNYPLTKKFNLFARAGAAYMNVTTQSNVEIDLRFLPNTPDERTLAIHAQTNSSNHSNFWNQINPVLGVGDEYFFTPRLSFRFEYDYYFPVKLHGDNAANSGTLVPSIILGELNYFL
jgi:opacity protein-like surface antigen